MNGIMRRIFAGKHEDLKSPAARGRCGFVSGVVGVFVNLVLFGIKLLAGILSGSISIQADAFNNLSDAASSVVSMVSFRLSSKPADRDHPYGHERIEYVASMAVSFLILLMGYELVKGAIDKILHPASTVFSALVFGILAVSVAAKLGLFLLNHRIARAIDSEVLKATAADSLSDAVATTAVLASALVGRFTSFDPDAYMALAVAAFILYTGLKVLNDSKNAILGGVNSAELAEQILAIVDRYPKALGIHDLMVHAYGPVKRVASLHVEVDGRDDIFEMHDMIDNLERTIGTELGVVCTIHMDPIVVGDPVTDTLRERLVCAIEGIDGALHIHDFRCVIGKTHTNLIFDVAAPFELALTDTELIAEIQRRVQTEMGEDHFAVVTVDRQ